MTIKQNVGVRPNEFQKFWLKIEETGNKSKLRGVKKVSMDRRNEIM